MTELSVVPPSLATFGIVGFVSVMPINTDDKPVLATKIGQRWRISSSQKLLGDGEQLCQMFARSRIIVLERFHDTHISFLCAIAQCCSVNNIKSAGNTDGCKTLREAVKQIEKDPNLENLRSTICASFTNHYQCPYCLSIADSMIYMTNAVPLYQQSSKDDFLYAFPFVSNASSSDKTCPKCEKQLADTILPLFRQTHQRCPKILMLRGEPSSRRQLSNLRLKLINNSTDTTHVYEFISALLVDQYKSISLLKFVRPSHWIVYCQPPYSVPTSLSDNDIDDLFITAQSFVLFFDRVSSDSFFKNLKALMFFCISSMEKIRLIDRVLLMTCSSEKRSELSKPSERETSVKLTSN